MNDTPVDSPRGRIVVLGMHRSGTSCVSELLVAMGAYFGPAAMGTKGNPSNPHGLFERRDLRRLCHYLLQQCRGDWWTVSRFAPDSIAPAARARADRMLGEMLADLDAHRPWVIKDPRLCLLLPMLRDRLGETAAVCVWRDPLEVAESLRTRDAIPTAFGIALWEHYVRATFATDTPKVILSYSRLIDDPAETARRLLADLEALGVTGLRMLSAEQLLQVVDPALRRSNPRHANAEQILTDAQRRLLAALQAGDPTAPAFAVPTAPEQMAKLAAWEQARRDQMCAAAYQALAEARDRAAPEPLPARLHRIIVALRYVPWRPAQWLRWRRRGNLQQRLRQHRDACLIAAGGAFDASWYVQRYSDVASSRIDPLLHFVYRGAAEGRDGTPHASTARHLHDNLRASEGVNLAAASLLAKQH